MINVLLDIGMRRIYLCYVYYQLEYLDKTQKMSDFD